MYILWETGKLRVYIDSHNNDMFLKGFVLFMHSMWIIMLYWHIFINFIVSLKREYIYLYVYSYVSGQDKGVFARWISE